MEQGRLAEHIRKRAVCPRLFHENPQHGRMIGTGRQTALFSLLVTAQETMIIQEDGDAGVLAVSISNRLLSMFARPIGLMAEIILPLDYTEESLRKLVGILSEKCRELSMDLSAVDTRCENSATLPIVAAFGVGERISGRHDDEKAGRICKRHDDEKAGRVRSQYDGSEADVVRTVGKAPERFSIIMAGYCGSYGTKLLYREEEIRRGFPASFLKNAEEIFRDLSSAKAAAIMGGTAIFPYLKGKKENAGAGTGDGRTGEASVRSCVYMVTGGETGVFGALWDLSEDLKTGFRVELEKIPLRQETIEFCEKKDVSPYEIDARGILIGVTDTPGPVLEALLEEGIPSEVIGYLSRKKEKCLLGAKTEGYEREIRFLDSPR